MNVESPQLQVFILTNPNWTMEVALDEYNAQFGPEEQAYEAASRAVEVFMRARNDYKIVMNPDSRDEKPQLATTILAHLKGTDPGNATVVFTYICLMDCGYPKQAEEMENELKAQIALMKKKELEQAEQEKKLQEDLAMFDDLKVQAGKKARKPKTPKNNTQ